MNSQPPRSPLLVLLAAGASERLGQIKALAKFPGGTPLERLVAGGICSGAAEALVVTGRHHAAIKAAIPTEARWLENPAWRAGRTGSLQVAAAAVPGRDLLIAPVDCPRVPPQVFQALREEWSAKGSPSRGWLAPKALDPQGIVRHGHPILIGREALVDLGAMGPDEPLRDLRGRCDPVWGLLVPHAEVLEDLDTPEDFRTLLQRDQDRL